MLGHGLDFRHLLLIKHSVVAPLPSQPLERYGVPAVLPGGHRGLGEPGAVAPTLPHAVPLHPGKQTSPCHRSPVHLCPARFGHCIPSHCSFSRAGIEPVPGTCCTEPRHLAVDNEEQRCPRLRRPLLFPGPCPLITPLPPFGFALLRRFTHPLPSPDSKTMPFG